MPSFHFLSSFLDSLLLIPCSISLSLLTVSRRAILLRMRPNSLDLNSWRAERLRRSRKSSPLRSTTSSSSFSVSMARISSSSCSRFALTTAGAPNARRPRNEVRGVDTARPRGVEVRGEAAARDIVAISVFALSVSLLAFCAPTVASQWMPWMRMSTGIT